MNLTKQEIIEGLTEALVNELSAVNGEQLKYKELPQLYKEGWQGIINRSIISALSDMGVLELVEGEAKEGDIIQDIYIIKKLSE